MKPGAESSTVWLEYREGGGKEIYDEAGRQLKAGQDGVLEAMVGMSLLFYL